MALIASTIPAQNSAALTQVNIAWIDCFGPKVSSGRATPRHPDTVSRDKWPLGYCEAGRRMGGPRNGDIRSYLNFWFPELRCGLFEPGFARRPHKKRDVGLRNGEAGRIDRRGERGFVNPPQEPGAEFLPLKPQRRLQARLEKPLTLRWGEPRPASQRRLNQINAPHFACL